MENSVPYGTRFSGRNFVSVTIKDNDSKHFVNLVINFAWSVYVHTYKCIAIVTILLIIAQDWFIVSFYASVSINWEQITFLENKKQKIAYRLFR